MTTISNDIGPGAAIAANPSPATASPTGASGFAPIPTRLQDLAPLVVGREEGEPANPQVVDQLEQLESQVAQVHAVCAEAYTSQGLWDRALSHIEVAVQYAADEMAYHNQAGYLRYLTGDDQGALKAFERVVEAIPTQVDALSNLGIVWFGLENWAQAKQWFALAVQQSPSDAELWNNLGASIFKLGQPSEAAQYFHRALQIDPNNEDAKINLQSC